MQGKHINEQVRLYNALTATGQAMVATIVAALVAHGEREETARIKALWEVYRMAEA